MDQMLGWLNYHAVAFGTTVATIALLIGGAIVVFAVNRTLVRWVGWVQGRMQVPYEATLGFSRAVTAAIWVLTGLLILEVWGVGLGGLWTLLASAAALVGVGFLATWTMVSNVTASLFLSLWRPFNLGQVVEIIPENLKGRVIDRNLMFTELREEGGSVISVPNNLFFQKIFKVADVKHRTQFEMHEARGRSVGADAGPQT